MLEITMPRGDIRLVRFQVYDMQTGDVSQVDFNEIYMSVKKSLDEKEVLFQKKLSDGGIEKLGIGDYQLKIEPADTDNLVFNKTYPFDIELIFGNDVKQTEYGELTLTPEVTWVRNEVN